MFTQALPCFFANFLIFRLDVISNLISKVFMCMSLIFCFYVFSVCFDSSIVCFFFGIVCETIKVGNNQVSVMVPLFFC